jgi:DNA-binding response OmpR family regulator
MQILNTKAARGQIARPLQTGEEGSAALIMKTQVAQFARASGEPDAEGFCELLSRIPRVDSREIQEFSSFVPVIVFLPRSMAKQQAARKFSAATPPNESSDARKVLGILRKAAERLKNANAESTVMFGDVTVNFCAMEVRCKGEPVVLTMKEFKTLEYLIRNARRVISRDELLNEVWGYENYPCTRTVDNHILRLRQKLESDPSRPVHFRTMHGSGYKFLP